MSKRLPIHVPPPPRTKDVRLNEYFNRITRAIERLRDRLEDQPARPVRKWPLTPSPLELISTHFNSNTGSTNCYVCPGSVIEHIFGSDSVMMHPFKYSNATHLSNTAIPVSNGQSVYANYYVHANATVLASSAALQVANSNRTGTTHWIPDTPELAGSGGNVDIELFRVTTTNNSASAEKLHDGNPEHYQDAWFGNNAGNGAGVYRNVATDGGRLKYFFRTIVGGANTTVTEREDDILINATATTSGGDLNLTLWRQDYSLGASDEVIWLNSTTSNTHYWRDGLYTGQTDPADGLGTDEDADYWVQGS